MSTQLGIGLGLAAGLSNHTTSPGFDHFFLEAGRRPTALAGVVLAAVLAALHRTAGVPRSGVSRTEQASERAALVEQDEDHCRTGQCDQGQCREVGDQVEIKTHGWKADERHDA